MFGRNFAKDIQSEDMLKVCIGNEWGEIFWLVVLRTFRDRTRDTAHSVAAKGASRVHVGNRYGGRSIFDG